MPTRIEIEISSAGQLLPQGAHALCHNLLLDTDHHALHSAPYNLVFPSWQRERDGYLLSIATPDDAVARSLLQGVLSNRPLRLGAVAATLGNARSMRRARWDELLATASDRLVKRIDLHFSTPTCFRNGSVNVPLPIPSLIGASALRVCRPWIPEEINTMMGASLAHVHVAAASLDTQEVVFGHKTLVGFQGRVRLGTKQENAMRTLSFLEQVLPYVHLGAKGGYGMGQVWTSDALIG